MTIESFVSGRKWLFAPKSYLMDRVVPDIEQILLPAATTESGVITIDWPNSETTRPSGSAGKKERIWSELSNRFRPVRLSGDLVVDLRVRWPHNWAHVLNNHLPLALYLRDLTRKNVREMSVLFDRNAPDYVVDLFMIFGFKVNTYSGRVTTTFLNFDAEPWICIRSIAYKWVQNYFHVTGIRDEIFRDTEELPSKIFINRKKTRTLQNQRDVIRYLSSRGFVVIYPEDLSPQRQLKLFADAEQVVAIHGANMAPLLFRDIENPGLRVVELLSPGHMTNYYRIMSEQVGAAWAGVRGRIEPKHLKYAYRQNQRFSKYSLSPFYVDIESLEAAMDSV